MGAHRLSAGLEAPHPCAVHPFESRAAASARPRRPDLLYLQELGISRAAGADPELFNWFLACALLGARISETIARHTSLRFARHRLLSPVRILAAGWDTLVKPVLREGGYVRYDHKTATHILRDCTMLQRQHLGSLRRLHAAARECRDLKMRIDRLYGVGPITVDLLLRKLRPW